MSPLHPLSAVLLGRCRPACKCTRQAALAAEHEACWSPRAAVLSLPSAAVSSAVLWCAPLHLDCCGSCNHLDGMPEHLAFCAADKGACALHSCPDKPAADLHSSMSRTMACSGMLWNMSAAAAWQSSPMGRVKPRNDSTWQSRYCAPAGMMMGDQPLALHRSCLHGLAPHAVLPGTRLASCLTTSCTMPSQLSEWLLQRLCRAEVPQVGLGGHAGCDRVHMAHLISPAPWQSVPEATFLCRRWWLLFETLCSLSI